MSASSHRELHAWQFADAIRKQIIELCEHPRVNGDHAFCDQANRAAASACRNIAEGFARYGHPEFARFVIIARASMAELVDTLDEALAKRYIDGPQHEALNREIARAMATMNGLRRYLQRTKTPAEH
jgi:four helix bundle protein